ncbi:universal stress protein [Aliiroseovarius subalbicans]|uniref:universal stress protein n=1 Tax=Aliiroseovarius subalbicans TaxID=2925840 RepID=UPI001F576D20|nr:universal stress protein [Aliiroseovarius subalbicans]MCI2400639.1 universal stress protein [Aliiroseovarius subalbicans]
MAYKTITTILTDAVLNASSFPAAISLSEHAGAHLDVLCLGLDRAQPGFYYAGASAMVVQDNLAQAREDALALEDQARKTLEGGAINWSTTGLSAQMVALNGVIAHRTRFSDLVVLPRPYGEGRGHDSEAIVEAALFNGAVPVLITPDDAEVSGSFTNIVIAWNESTEALRAIRSALPFLQAAENVSIAIIDPPQHGPERSDPGGALSQMLSRHGVRAEVSVLARTMPRVSDILNRHVRDQNADLLVMGAYGHSRFRESILGGATRHMLEVSEVPILMAH